MLPLLSTLLIVTVSLSWLEKHCESSVSTPFNLAAIEEEMTKQCPGASSNNWAIEYAVNNDYLDAVNANVRAIPHSFFEIIDDNRAAIRMEFSFSWEIGCPLNFSSLCRRWPQLNDTTGEKMAEIMIQRRAFRSPPWKPRLRHENYDKDPHPFDLMPTWIDLLPCYGTANWVVPGMFWTRCRPVGDERPPNQLECPITILSELTKRYVRFSDVQFFFAPYGSNPELSAAQFMGSSQTWRVDPNLTFNLEDYDMGDYSNYHRLTFMFNFYRVTPAVENVKYFNATLETETNQI